MRTPLTLIAGIANRLLSGASSDDAGGQSDQPVRLGRCGELWAPEIASNDFGYAEEGSYFIATNPVIGTGLTKALSGDTAFSDTKPLLYIYNGEPAGGKSIGLRFIKLINTGWNVTQTSALQYALVLDPRERGLSSNVMTSGPSGIAGTGIQVHALNGAGPLPSGLVVRFQQGAGDSAIAASSPQKITVGRGTLGGSNASATISDTATIVFGTYKGCSFAWPNGNKAAGGSNWVTCEAPVLIPPGWSLTAHMWAPGWAAATAFSYECTIGFRAR